MYLFIDGTQRQYIRNSIKIIDELQERINSATFNLDGSFDISYYEEVKIYQGAKIVSLSGTALVIDRDYTQTEFFRAGDEIWLGLGLSTEEAVTIASVDKKAITLTASASSSHNAEELMGKKMFAGVVPNVSDFNIGTLKNLEYSATCVDYTRIFDKELINESYEDRDGRYIINDFCNGFINKNTVIDQLDYDTNGDIQTEWVKTGTVNLAETDDTDPYEKDHWGMFSGTGAVSGTYTASPVSSDVSSYVGVSSGQPTQGILGFWIKANTPVNISNFQIKLGSDSSNYIITSDLSASIGTDPIYLEVELKDLSITGTPNWLACDFATIELTTTGNAEVRVAGLRFLEDERFKHYPNVRTTTSFADFNIPRVKPIEVMQRIADELAWYWYIDYDRNIHLFSQETNAAPFSITNTSNNFKGLKLKWDTSRLVNRQVVKGADEVSLSTYSQVVEGDSVLREWLMKTKFKNLVVSLDDNTSTDTMEAGTTTTNVEATSHGLVTGDYIVNRSRSNAIRKITRVDDDNFTVLAVPSQASGDTFSKFVEQTVGVEGFDDETSFDYMSNFNEKSIRSSADTATLQAAEFLLFKYNEVVAILVQRRNGTSVDNMISILGYTNGIVDGTPIVDRTIKTRAEAQKLADAQLTKYSNVIISAKFSTTCEGLKSGQIIRITDTGESNRNIDQDFMIQKVQLREFEDGENVYNVTCSSSLFGIMELFQQLLRQGRKLEVDEDAKIEKIEDINEEITTTIAVTSSVNGNLIEEEISMGESAASALFTPPYKWGPHADQGSWNLCEWG
jgi:hypothetical protein